MMNQPDPDFARTIIDELIQTGERFRPQTEPPEPEQAARKALAFTMVGDLIANPKPPSWLIRGTLEADSLALLYGPPKKGKSFIAVDWACSIATGADWHGHQTKQVAVFYLAGEGHNGLARRFTAWSKANEISLTDAPLAVSNRAVPLIDIASAEAVEQAVAQLAEQTKMQPGLIVVDTLARNFGGNENDSRDMSAFIQHLDGIRETYKATVLVVHHSGKDEARGARGSTALFGAIDAAFSVGQDESKTVTLTPEAMKDAALPAPMLFNLAVVELGIEDDEGHPVTSCCPELLSGEYSRRQRKMTAKQQRLMGFIWEALKLEKTLPPASVHAAPRPPKSGQIAVSERVLREHVQRCGGLTESDKPDTQDKAFRRNLNGLQESGIIEVFDDWIWLADKSDKPGHFGFCPNDTTGFSSGHFGHHPLGVSDLSETPVSGPKSESQEGEG